MLFLQINLYIVWQSHLRGMPVGVKERGIRRFAIYQTVKIPFGRIRIITRQLVYCQSNLRTGFSVYDAGIAPDRAFNS